MEITHHRYQATSEDIEKVFTTIRNKLTERLAEKGQGIYVSSHELLGILDEEFGELREAVQMNHLGAIDKETLDIAIGAIWAMVSINTKKMDWPK
jgi:hypothetical protein